MRRVTTISRNRKHNTDRTREAEIGAQIKCKDRHREGSAWYGTLVTPASASPASITAWWASLRAMAALPPSTGLPLQEGGGEGGKASQMGNKKIIL